MKEEKNTIIEIDELGRIAICVLVLFCMDKNKRNE